MEDAAGTRERRLGLAAIVAWFVGCELLIWPRANVPIVDDWTYAWSVRHLLETGRLEVLPISAVYPVTQIVWGTLFSAVSGFSFSALRLSTVVLACIGALALYLTLCELRVGRTRALLGTFCVVCNPVSIVLTHSFMTDVPLVSCSSCAAYAYVRGWMRREQAWFWLAALLSVAAVLVRQVAIVLPFAAVVASVLARDRVLRRRALPPALVACALVVAAWLGVGRLVGPSLQQAERLTRLPYIWDVGLSGYAALTFEMVLTLSFMLLPLAAALAFGRGARWMVAAVGVAALGYAVTAPLGWSPLDPDRATLSLYELGGARNLIAGSPTRPEHWNYLAEIGRLLSFIGLGAAVAAFVRRRVGSMFEQPAEKFFVMLAVAYVGLISLLWLYCDRYYLMLLPAIVVCVLTSLRAVKISIPVAAALLALQTGIGIVGTRDALAYNDACARMVAELIRAGVRPYDIDGGWSFNGWMLYAQPDNLPAGLDRERDVPAVTAKTVRPYLLAKAPVPGYRPIRHLQWRAKAWPWPNELYVLQASDPRAASLLRR